MDATHAFGRGRTRRRKLAFSTVLAIALVAMMAFVAGCGGSDDSSDDGDASAAGSGGNEVLAVSIGSEPGSLDPLLKSDGPRDTFGLSVYEGLTTRVGDQEGTTIEPLLATEWELDGKAWIFTLREGVTFHDGSELTADDVVASWKRMLSPGSEHLDSKVLSDTKVKAIDDQTVSIARPVADPTTPSRAALVMIVPEEYAALKNDQLAKEMMGTGPYKFDGWNRGQNIDLSAYPDYWGDAPSIQAIDVQFDEEVAVRLASLEAGEIQMALNMSPELVNDKFVSVGTPVSEVSIMRLNSISGPFEDIRVRQAANMAIDRDTLIEQIWGGYATSAGGQEVADYVFGHNASLEAPAFDPDGARALLEEADAVGTKVEIWGTRGHWTSDAQLGQAVEGMMNDAGFAAELKQPPFDKWVEMVFVAETDDEAAPDIMLYNHSNELFDSSLTIGQNLTCEGASSTTCIPEVDKLAEQALAIADDQDARQELYDEIWQILTDDSAFVSLAEVQKLTFHSNDLSWTPEPDGFLRFQNMSFSS